MTESGLTKAGGRSLLGGRVILITGAGGGLGSVLAEACAQAGATVVLAGRTLAKLESVYDRIVAGGGPQPAIMPINLLSATWGSFEDLAGLVEQEFGRLDGLVHAATHFRGFVRLEDLEPREWLDSLQVNLTASYTLTRVCLPLLRRSEDASVVFVSDASGRSAKAFHGIYGICKAAVEAMMAAWALELEAEVAGSAGLRFNSYDPGPLRTAHRIRGYLAEPPERVPPPETATPALLSLLGPESRGTSGQAFGPAAPRFAPETRTLP